MDDAIHIRNPVKTSITLCNQSVKDINVINIKKAWPDPWSGCWTCLAEAEKITEKISNGPAS
jgi:hypothetical protein